MDDIDRAQNHEELHREIALKRQKQIILGDADRVVLHGHCINCGTEIEPARKEALPHARTCIDCAEAAERHRRLHANNGGAW